MRTWQGWLYLAIVMDLFSRKVVGWAARPTIHRELVLDAVLMAVRARRPRGTLIHSDQGMTTTSGRARETTLALRSVARVTLLDSHGPGHSRATSSYKTIATLAGV